MSPATERIELLRKRSFGEVVGDTFAFIRLNLAVILKVHFLFSLPVILVTAGIFLLLFRDHFSLLHTIDSGPFEDSIAFRDDFTNSAVSIFFSMMAMIPVSTTTFLIVDRYYHSPTGKVTFEDVVAIAKRKYLLVLAAKLVIAPIIFFTSLILVLPGLAFFTLFMCVELLIIQHNYGIFKAIGKSSNIMTKFFWSPFPLQPAFLDDLPDFHGFDGGSGRDFGKCVGTHDDDHRFGQSLDDCRFGDQNLQYHSRFHSVHDPDGGDGLDVLLDSGNVKQGDDHGKDPCDWNREEENPNLSAWR